MAKQNTNIKFSWMTVTETQRLTTDVVVSIFDRSWHHQGRGAADVTSKASEADGEQRFEGGTEVNGILQRWGMLSIRFACQQRIGHQVRFGCG
jgi:hypothetical protein